MTTFGKGLEMAAGRSATVDVELVQTLLNATSPVEVTLALALLRQSTPENDLVRMVNLREILADVPTPPFAAGTDLAVLGRALGYERTERSWRTFVDCEAGICGIEFIGDGNAVAGIVLHAVEGRVVLHGAADSIISPAALDMLMRYEELADALIEALREIGMPLAPLFYLSMNDFISEQTRAGIADVSHVF